MIHASKKCTSSQALKAKVTKSIEQQMVSAASAGKLTIMKNAAPEPYVCRADNRHVVRSRYSQRTCQGLKKREALIGGQVTYCRLLIR
ncbi:hypothetical protein BS17DRAFT_786280 [Gyrodon lividus]|nr:hypothetical protein BS17DRAFT_786280 [Gyrodon lividus]